MGPVVLMLLLKLLEEPLLYLQIHYGSLVLKLNGLNRLEQSRL